MNTYQIHFKLVLLFFFFGKQALGQTCYTLDKQQGHCVPLNECPKALRMFANPPKGSETHLHWFLCKGDQQLKVCCAATANFTMLEIYLIPGYADISKQIVQRDAFKEYCDSGPLSSIDLPLIVAESVVPGVNSKKCLGILANSRYVITPAQCVGQQFILIGVQFRGKNNNSITFGVEEIISHPFFDPVSGVNDLALLRLNQTVSSDDVAASCIGEFWQYGLSIFVYTNLDLFTIERGLNKTTVSTASLSKGDCEEKFRQKGAYAAVTEYDVCTTNLENATKYTCNEFNGILFNDELGAGTGNVCTSNLENATKFTCNEFTGVPVFSDSMGSGTGFIGFSSSRTVCDDGLPDIYTKVEAYRSWLIDQMRPWPTKNDPCTTPNGEIGECWSVFHCPALLDAFTDVTNAAEAAPLLGYICERSEDVCCATSSNFTMVHRQYEPKSVGVPTKFLETALCGLQHRDDYFSSSTAVAIDEFPWIAEIRSTRRHCTGTLINTRYVLTSATCVTLTLDTTIVRLGGYYRFKETSCVKDPNVDATYCTEIETYGIEDIKQHPFYSPFYGLNNIGLLRLNETVSYYTDFIRPICLPIPGTSTAKVGDTMYMSSWAHWRYLDDFSERGTKTKVLTQLIGKKKCQQLRRKEILSNTFCTIDYENYTDIDVERDTGGALMFHDNYRWHIEGIRFRGPEYPDDPVVYVNVSSYINWILANMNPW